MANRTWSRDGAALEKGVVKLFAQAAIGASGAATISALKSKGVASIARDGSTAGKYTITLQDAYQRLLGIVPMVTLSSGMPTAPAFHVISEDVDGAKTIVVQFSGPTAEADTELTATDLASGAVLNFEITLSNSTAL